jgi:peroxiredoxin
MIRKLAFIFLLLILAAIGYLSFSIYGQLQERKAVEKRIAVLPEFSAMSLNGRTVQVAGMVRKDPSIIIYFNTECRFCKAEINDIRQHDLLQDQASVYLISNETLNVLKEFYKELKLDSLSNIQMLRDNGGKVRELFGVTGVPSTYVYSPEGMLLKHFKGETKAEILYELISFN